jgi:hypothetical protein
MDHIEKHLLLPELLVRRVTATLGILLLRICCRESIYRAVAYECFEKIRHSISRSHLLLQFIAMLRIPSQFCTVFYFMYNANTWADSQILLRLPSNTFRLFPMKIRLLLALHLRKCLTSWDTTVESPKCDSLKATEAKSIKVQPRPHFNTSTITQNNGHINVTCNTSNQLSTALNEQTSQDKVNNRTSHLLFLMWRQECGIISNQN